MASYGKDSLKRLLLSPARFFNTTFAYTARVELACSRGALNVATRRFRERDPGSWEFSAFSQNGEDGIVDHLMSLIRTPNHYFLEVGASDGLENNSSYLAYVKKYPGVMVEADAFLSTRAERFLQSMNWAVKYLNLMVTPDLASQVIDECLHTDPDFFSLDIDGNDYFVARALLEGGLRPKTVCVEYNSAFGPSRSVTIPYSPGLDYLTFHPSQLYYGVSIAAWRTLFEEHGYSFVSVETHGINAFFIDPQAVGLPPGTEAIEFAENTTQLRRHGAGWEVQFDQIRTLPLIDIA
jgi:hypothetical protein